MQKESMLYRLKQAINIQDFAKLLNFDSAALTYILYILPVESKYKVFKIPKKSGDSRIITAPTDRLKNLQKNLSLLLYQCIAEINSPILQSENVATLKFAHGFLKNKNIVTGAKYHRNKKYVVNFDLKNFYDSINFGRVRGFFIKDKNFQLNEKIATIIAQIACFNNCLPQGSPCSPIISNLIGNILDVHIYSFLKHKNCSYSRYADDITISSNYDMYKNQIIELNNEKVICLSTALREIIEKNKFTINHSKTRYHRFDQRQEVTGLVVNKKINIKYEEKRKVRAMIHSLYVKGYYHTNDPNHKLTNVNFIDGKLNWFYYIGKQNAIDYSNSNIKSIDNKFLSGIDYQKFIFYKEFLTSDKPVILCEGKTDIVYLYYAIKSMASEFPNLINETDEKPIKIKFYKYLNKLDLVSKNSNILGLHGGTGHFNGFIEQYKKFNNIFSSEIHKRKHPVIIVLDNDNATRRLLNHTKQYSRKIFIEDVCINLFDNLYLLIIPKINNSDTYIEKYFDERTLRRKINGKSFSHDNDFDNTIYYGKNDFANLIIKEFANEVDFSMFKEIIKYIDCIIVDYNKKFGYHN